MSRRVVVLAVAGFLTVLLAAVAALLPVPYVALQPGPTTNTLGAVGKTELIRIEGRRTYPDRGHLDLVTVSVLGGPRHSLDLVTALRGWLDDSVAVVPEETVYPKDETAQEAEQQSAAEMSDSQENATTAALRSLGIPVQTTVVVQDLPAGSPSAGKLRKGDEIVSVDGKTATGGASLRATVVRYLGEERTSRSFEGFAHSRGQHLEGKSEADIHTLRYAEHLLASAIGTSSSRLAMSLLLRRRTVSTKDALKLLDDASALNPFSADTYVVPATSLRPTVSSSVRGGTGCAA